MHAGTAGAGQLQVKRCVAVGGAQSAEQAGTRVGVAQGYFKRILRGVFISAAVALQVGIGDGKLFVTITFDAGVGETVGDGIAFETTTRFLTGVGEVCASCAKTVANDETKTANPVTNLNFIIVFSGEQISLAYYFS